MPARSYAILAANLPALKEWTPGYLRALYIWLFSLGRSGTSPKGLSASLMVSLEEPIDLISTGLDENDFTASFEASIAQAAPSDIRHMSSIFRGVETTGEFNTSSTLISMGAWAYGLCIAFLWFFKRYHEACRQAFRRCSASS